MLATMVNMKKETYVLPPISAGLDFANIVRHKKHFDNWFELVRRDVDTSDRKRDTVSDVRNELLVVVVADKFPASEIITYDDLQSVVNMDPVVKAYFRDVKKVLSSVAMVDPLLVDLALPYKEWENYLTGINKKITAETTFQSDLKKAQSDFKTAAKEAEETRITTLENVPIITKIMNLGRDDLPNNLVSKYRRECDKGSMLYPFDEKKNFEQNLASFLKIKIKELRKDALRSYVSKGSEMFKLADFKSVSK
jgi:hypothetical protein